MCELDHKEDWAPKNWYFWAVVLEKTLEKPLNCKEIKPMNFKESQPWTLIGRTDAKAPILWPPEAPILWSNSLQKIEVRRRRGRQRMRWLDSITDSIGTWVWASSGRWWRTGKPGVLQSKGSQKRLNISIWNRAGPYGPSLPSMPSACLSSMENFSQRLILIRELRNVETKENNQRRLNNNSVVIKHSQKPLIFSQEL